MDLQSPKEGNVGLSEVMSGDKLSVEGVLEWPQSVAAVPRSVCEMVTTAVS